MNGQPELTPQIATTIREYLELLKRERKIKGQKRQLSQKLAEHLEGHGSYVTWHTTVDDQDVVVKMMQREKGVWDEELLKQRLGERYKAVLMPDPAKIRLHAEVVRTLLDSIIEDVGSPNKQAVREALKEGSVSRDEIEGTLQSDVRTSAWVMRDRTAWEGKDVEQARWAGVA